MSWKSYISGFKAFLQLERSLSQNSIENYLRDVGKLERYFSDIHSSSPELKNISTDDLRQFIQWINEIGMSARSQARILSGIKAFFNYLLLENPYPSQSSGFNRKSKAWNLPSRNLIN